MNVDVKVNPAYLKYMNLSQFIQIFFGGSSSGKSYFLAQKVVIDNLNGVNWLLTRNVAKTIRNSLFNEVSKAISTMQLSMFYKINKSDMVVTCTINSKQILFAGLDDPEKIKSVTPVNGVLERILMEEATECSYHAYKQLTKRLRGRSEHKKCIVFAFNPILKSHWIYKEFFGNWDDSKNYYSDNRISILKTTYKDNIFLTKADREILENESDPYYYQVYTLGNWGVLGHVIYKNWKTADLSNFIKTYDNVRNGLDFGYSSDPNALIRIHLDKAQKKIYVFDEHYQAGMSDSQLVDVVKEKIGNQIVTCDGAEPKTIDLLNDNGINAYAAVKGPDSINRGIRFLQGFEIIVDVNCQNFKNEIELYHWREDKYGNAMGQAVDKDNHLLDALRYAVEDDMLNAGSVSAGIRI